MKARYRLFRRHNGTFFCEDRETRQQESLRTKDRAEATRLLCAKNEAHQQPGFGLHVARAYLAAADPALAKRTWRSTCAELIKSKQSENALRWQRAIKDAAFRPILDLPLIQTRPEHFLDVLHAGTVSTHVFLRRLHNYAAGFGWLLAPVLHPKQWPKVRYGPKRAISHKEHEKIIGREQNPERRAFYELLWELGGSQGDIARLHADDIDWTNRGISYARAKTGQPA